MATRSPAALRPRKRPSQARSRATVDAILEAAARIFADRGYAAATTNHIAARAGVSVGSLYEYFPNKDALLVALVDRHIAEAAALLGDVAERALTPATGLDAAVAAMVQSMIELHAQQPRLHRVLFEEAPLPQQVRERLEALEQAMAARVADYLRTRVEVTAPDAQVAATVLVQSIEALTHRLVIHRTSADQGELAAEMVTLATAYLTAPRTSQGARHEVLATAKLQPTTRRSSEAACDPNSPNRSPGRKRSSHR